MTHINNPEQRLGRVDELDGLRGLLSLWVVLAHIFCWTGFMEFFTAPHAFRPILVEFIGAGGAVETFMILSGFAISFLLNKRHQSYGQFMLGRFFRIYPVYFVCLLLGFMVALHFTPYVLHTAQWRGTVYFEWNRSWSSSELSETGWQAFWHLTLLNGLIPRRLLSNATATFLVPAWSISLEWQYYLVAPFLARFVRSGAGLLFLTALAWLGLRLAHGWTNPHVAFLPAQLPLFLIGIGSYHLYEQFAKLLHRRSSVFAVPVAALLATGILTSWHSTALTLWALGFGCIFIQGDDPLSRTLSALRAFLLYRWLQRLGHISYCVYLVHWPLLIAFLAALLYWRPEISSTHALLLMLFLGLPLILFVASILHTWIERPLMTLGKRRNGRTQITPNAPETA
jgi:peptidoglycan/LPS O-acetylase OafA/YrhL